MFYFQELLYRFFYLIISFLVSFLLLYNFKSYFFLIILSSLYFSSLNESYFFETSFILNSPNQLIEMNLLIIFNFSIFFLFPFIYWNLYQFLKPSLLKKELIFFKTTFLFWAFCFYVFNNLLLIYIFPYVWSIFELLNLYLLNSSYINLEYEPNFSCYLYTLQSIIIIINAFILLIYIYSYTLFRLIKFDFYIVYYKLIIIFYYTIFFIFIFFIFDLNALLLVFSLFSIIILLKLKSLFHFLILFREKKRANLNYYAIKKSYLSYK
jgi:hypothetical protein